MVAILAEHPDYGPCEIRLLDGEHALISYKILHLASQETRTFQRWVALDSLTVLPPSTPPATDDSTCAAPQERARR